MPHQPVIDGFEFASAGATQQGVWPLSEFPRLRDMLASDAGEVAYRLQGTRDEHGRPALQVRVEGSLQLNCQRCLEPLACEVRVEDLLVLAATLSEIHAEPADVHAPDRVVAGKEMPVRDLIEDLNHRGVKLVFGRVNPYLRADMDRHGITAAIGEACIFKTLHEALAAVRPGRI